VGARLALRDRGFFEECLCLTDYRAQHLGTWWKALHQKSMGRSGKHLALDMALLPRDMARQGDGLFAEHKFYTMIRLPMAGVSLPVEMDWKDLDGYNCLSGKDYAYVEEAALAAIDLNLAQKQVPTISLEWEGTGTVGQLGALAVFMELSAALSAVCSGATLFDHTESDGVFRRLEAVLERNFSNLSN
jgi:glucose-6-phosphate isomerase